MEAVVAQAQSSPSTAPSLAQAVAHLPGWGEKNFQVMSKQFEVIRIAAADPGGYRQPCPSLPCPAANLVTP